MAETGRLHRGATGCPESDSGQSLRSTQKSADRIPAHSLESLHGYYLNTSAQTGSNEGKVAGCNTPNTPYRSDSKGFSML